MLSSKSVTKQLRQIKCDYAVWGRSEIHELSGILMDNERIMQAVNGYYDGGFALLCITNYRVLVVDKKPFLLTVEDLRYDMIAEVDYSARIFTSVLHVYTPMRTLMFTSWSMSRLRTSMNYIQQRVMELRNNDYLASQFATAVAQKDKGVPLKRQQNIAKRIFQLRQNREVTKAPAPSPAYVEANEPDSSPNPAQPQSAESQTGSVALSGVETQSSHLAQRMTNPYTKVPLLARRRKYPSFY